ncbi:hypothetical protein N7481_009805 [Penicillium waksmanii]|uniref:uncharacterized protein n=1 Tax=Penicillium waksmanii TaxID=69791 RepID=UPI002548FECF|nr:uncharacterized protein N7481_009805 [Penicillium waksmanii]KAJ5976098.1 hypothetical protein N7481_009805 [Penicillium waksmanii]
MGSLDLWDRAFVKHQVATIGDQKLAGRLYVAAAQGEAREFFGVKDPEMEIPLVYSYKAPRLGSRR